MTPEEKQEIDSMSRYEMCYRWRFGKVGDPIFIGDTGQYFAERLDSLGGFTPEISKQIGWK
jgi:hypothetical protein